MFVFLSTIRAIKKSHHSLPIITSGCDLVRIHKLPVQYPVLPGNVGIDSPELMLYNGWGWCHPRHCHIILRPCIGPYLCQGCHMQSVNTEGKDLFFHWIILVGNHCCLGTLTTGWLFRCISKSSNYDDFCQSGIPSHDLSGTIGVLFLKNPPPLSGKGENLEMLWKKMSKWDLKTVSFLVF